MNQLKIEVTKFTLVGLANFVLTLIIFTFLLKVMGINYLLSLGISWFLGMLFSYTLNFIWVFKPEEKLLFKSRLIKFASAGLVSISLNMLALRYLVEHYNLDPFFTQFALIPFIVLFNFATAKLWSLSPRQP